MKNMSAAYFSNTLLWWWKEFCLQPWLIVLSSGTWSRRSDYNTCEQKLHKRSCNCGMLARPLQNLVGGERWWWNPNSGAWKWFVFWGVFWV